ncbi:hypothetical protein L462_00287 [Enterobacter sp. BIDMC 26]|nr:hypothetical protein L462_00287 [Enterobacter sp. BIDMC 26]
MALTPVIYSTGIFNIDFKIDKYAQKSEQLNYE